MNWELHISFWRNTRFLSKFLFIRISSTNCVTFLQILSIQTAMYAVTLLKIFTHFWEYYENSSPTIQTHFEKLAQPIVLPTQGSQRAVMHVNIEKGWETWEFPGPFYLCCEVISNLVVFQKFIELQIEFQLFWQYRDQGRMSCLQIRKFIELTLFLSFQPFLVNK